MTTTAWFAGIPQAHSGVLEPPFFEIGPKSRLRLAPLELLARAAGRAGRIHDVRVVMTVPIALIAPLHAARTGVLLFAQGMDPDPMGDHVGRVFAESLVDAGADGVMLNHDAQPLDRTTLQQTVARAQTCGLDTIVCAAGQDDVLAAAALQPTAILFEPPELIGTATTGDRPWIGSVNEAVRRSMPAVLMMHAGGVSSAAVAETIMRTGADGTGSTSGVLSAADPLVAAAEFIAATRRGWDAAHTTTPTSRPAASDPEGGPA